MKPSPRPKHRQRMAIGIAVLCSGAGIAGIAVADSDGDNALEEIVVTALRRAQGVLDAPLSLSAYSGETLEEIGAQNFSSLLGLTPGLSQETARPGFQKYTIRGVNAGGQFGWRQGAATAIYLDETPLTTRTNFWFASPDVNLFDLDRVEVLRGPQGTLFGASAIGGAIRALPVAPDFEALSLRVQGELSQTRDAGDANWATRGSLNAPFAEGKGAMRLVLEQVDDAGFLDAYLIRTQDFTEEVQSPDVARLTDYNDITRSTGRLTFAFRPVENLSISPSIFWQRNRSGGASNSRLNALAQRNATVFAFNPAFEASGERYEFLEDELTVGALKVEADLGLFGGVRFISNTAVQDRAATQRDDVIASNGNWVEGFGFDANYDASMEPNFADFATRVDQITQEFRIESNLSSPFSYVAGMFYNKLEQVDRILYDFRGSSPELLSLYGLVDTITYLGVDSFEEEQFALFVDGSYALNERWEFSAGLRWTDYEQDLTRFVSSPAFGDPEGSRDRLPASASEVTPRVNLSYSPDSNLMIFGSAAQGFRTGGGNSPEIPIVGRCTNRDELPPRPDQFDPDSLWNYEIGAKGRLFEGATHFAVSAYLIDWTDIQTAVLYNCEDNATINWNDNAGSARITGLEAEIEMRLGDALQLRASLGLANGEFSSTTPAAGTEKGQPLPYLPETTASLGVEWTPGDLRLNGFSPFAAANWRYVSERVDPNNGIAANPGRGRELPAYAFTDLSLGLSDERWTIRLFARNLFDEDAPLEQLLLFNPPGFAPTGFDAALIREEFVPRPRTIGLTVEGRL